MNAGKALQLLPSVRFFLCSLSTYLILLICLVMRTLVWWLTLYQINMMH